MREGKIALPIGTTLVQIYNVLLRCLSEERKAKELDELEARCLIGAEGRLQVNSRHHISEQHLRYRREHYKTTL